MKVNFFVLYIKKLLSYLYGLYFYKFYLCVLTFIFFSLVPVYSYAVGISPDSVDFKSNEEVIILFNPNSYDINFSITGCNDDFIEVIRKGVISSESKRLLKVRYNPEFNNGIETCNLIFFFSDSFYATAFSIPLIFSNHNLLSNDDGILSNLFSRSNSVEQDKTAEQVSKSNIYFISGLTLLFLICLFFIIKFF
jgi:hypothetical protein